MCVLLTGIRRAHVAAAAAAAVPNEQHCECKCSVSERRWVVAKVSVGWWCCVAAAAAAAAAAGRDYTSSRTLFIRRTPTAFVILLECTINKLYSTAEPVVHHIVKFFCCNCWPRRRLFHSDPWRLVLYQGNLAIPGSVNNLAISVLKYSSGFQYYTTTTNSLCFARSNFHL